MTIDVAPLEAGSESDYTAFLQDLDESLLYYSISYKAFLEDLLHCHGRYWIARENGRIAGVLPILESDGPYGRVLNSLPYYGSNGGVLATSQSASDALWRQFDLFASADGVAAATIVCNPLLPEDPPPIAHDFVDERIGQFTPLTPGDDPGETVFGAIDGSTRRNVRKAQKSGVSVSVDNSALGFLEEVHRQNMAEIGGKAKSPRFFETFPKHFEADRDYRIYVAHIGDEPVAALLLFYFNSTVEYFTPVTVGAHRNSQPTALIIYQAMIDAIGRGYTRWNWGGTWLTQDGVYRFKRKWGAEDRPYKYYVRVNDRSLLSRRPDELLDAYPDIYVVPFDRLTAA